MCKVVLITGTSSGIGYDTALFLASKGYHVYASMRNLEKSKKLREKSQSEGLSVNICELDVRDVASIKKLVDTIIEKEKRLDVLINNAGFAVVGKFEESTNDDFKDQFATNFYGVLNCTRIVIPIMKKQNMGCIINISSILGIIGARTLSAYCASKFAMEGWSESVRYELKKYNVYITLLEPGFFKTEIFNNVQFVSASKTDKEIKSIGATPIKVARKIYNITKKKCPKVRYNIGYDCKIGGLIKKFLPSFLSEMILEKI